MAPDDVFKATTLPFRLGMNSMEPSIDIAPVDSSGRPTLETNNVAQVVVDTFTTVPRDPHTTSHSVASESSTIGSTTTSSKTSSVNNTSMVVATSMFPPTVSIATMEVPDVA